MKRFLFMFFMAALMLAGTSLAAPGFHDTTKWEIRPSLTFDALCLLNTLSGDSFYLEYYQADYQALAPKLTPAARESLSNIKRKIKDEHGGIISANLCLYFSATSDSTLDQLLATVANPSALQAAFKQTPYYDEADWQVFDSLRGDLRTVFEWLQEIKFEQFWRAEILPRITDSLRTLAPVLPQYNVIREDEAVLGAPLPSDRITVYLLYYSQPHGIKIVGTRFLTDIAWPFRIVVGNAVHEMLHPPFDLAADSELVNTLAMLKQDSLLMNKIEHHNPSFGYNSFDGFIEEDCVQALDQIASERLNLARDPRQRWKENDDGMHVLAVALYQVMKDENYNSRHEPFRDFLIRTIRSGRLGPGKIAGIYQRFYRE